MNQTNFLITLDLQDFNLEEVPENQLNNSKVNKLYKIPVTIRPYRDKRASQDMSGQNPQLG